MSNSIVTIVGLGKIAAAMAAAETINITHIALGSSDRAPTGGETSLVTEVYRDVISASGIVPGSPNEAYFSIIVPEDGVEPGFDYGPWFAQEIGLFDADGDLIAIGRFPQPLPKYDPASGSPNAIHLSMRVIFSNIEGINISYTPETNLPWATPEQFADQNDTNHIAHVSQIWTLFNQINIWIKADVTYTIGSDAGDDYATINDAMAYLKTWLIADGATVTLSLRAEVHAMAANIVIDHPMSHKIEIIGAAMAGAVPTVDDFTVNTNSPADRIADSITNLAMLRSRYSTEIAVTGAFGFRAETHLGLLKNLLFTGDGSASTGISVAENKSAFMETVSAHGFGQYGLKLNHANVSMMGGCLTVSGCGSDGIAVIDGGNLDARNATALVVVSCGLNGLVVKSGSNMWAADNIIRSYGCVSSGLQITDKSNAHADEAVIRNNQDGASVSRGSFLYMRNASSRYNAAYGVYVESHSAADISGGVFSSNSSPTADVLVTLQSHAIASGMTGSTSPAVNTTGNHNSRIRT